VVVVVVVVVAMRGGVTVLKGGGDGSKTERRGCIAVRWQILPYYVLEVD
jgi:hypothetical protein